MSERKSINRYYPPDYDPSQTSNKPKKKVKTGAGSLPTIRLMTPFSLKCTNCQEYISKSRKFNARKETTDKIYMGMKIIRFHIKCPGCASEIIFRTDYKSADYVIEYGAQKNYENSETTQYQLKEETMEETLERLQREEQEERAEVLRKEESKRTTVEELEEKLNDIHRQQDMHEELEEIRERNARIEKQRLNQPKESQSSEHTDDIEDEKIALEAFSKAHIPSIQTTPTVSKGVTKGVLTKKRKVSKLGIKIHK